MSIKILKQRNNQTILLLFLYVFFLFIRAPDILIQGRFWAEEGNIFYVNAYNMNPLHALFVVYGGYINLGASGATLIARFLHIPLEYAPYVTTFTGLFFQILPIYLLLTAKDEWLGPFHIRLLATLLLLFVPESSEISLQSLHIQFHLTLACAFIALLKTDAQYQRWFKLMLLFFAPLCGLLPIILLPIYLIQFINDKNYRRIEQFFALFLGSLIQLAFYLYNIKFNIDINSTTIARQGHFSFADLCSVIYVRDLVFPFLGHRYDVIIKIIVKIYYELQAHHLFIPILIIIGLSLVIALICMIKYSKIRSLLVFFITICLVIFFVVYGVIGKTILFAYPYYLNNLETSMIIMADVFHHLEINQVSIKSCVITCIFLGGVSSIFILYPSTRKAFILYITALLTLSLAVYGVIGGTIQLVNPYFTERYTFLSQALFAIMILHFSISLPKTGKFITNIVILWLLIVGSFNFFQLLPEAKDGGGHIWKQELQKWKQNSDYRPKIWSSGWYIVVPEQFSNSIFAPKK
ncbi:unnamed protein product [Commensalibacter communis]|uniref:Uncharacterized protein n=1 Tax=Commensalibacter communis TaxID=2972786 RepID=A0A9W4XA08_9PROT|nr:hypothetical protein [Commensalibacter communis]CAI3924665.1 unnamed protein product [Commensalibacter communis]CAI3925179.1 unnamed protein product [Commensalibacter communis]CAI3945476.1 unnamed protein product [Commensalibacter communis]CAI3946873.1 unnamed protein product [Commensalibacter communis]